MLLAYGQMAVKAKAHILPWVDNILSRMVFYFHYSSWVWLPGATPLEPSLDTAQAPPEPGSENAWTFQGLGALLPALT